MDNTNSIELYSGVAKMADPITAIERLGDTFAKSLLFGCANAAQGQLLAMVCLVEQKSPVEIMRDYDIIRGKMKKKTMAAYAGFRAKGGRVQWIRTGDDGIEARAKFTYEGQTIEHGYTWKQAEAAGLVKSDSAWQKTPGNMLRARVLSNGIAMLAPEVYAGDDVDSAPATEQPTIQLVQPTAEAPKTVQSAPVVLDVVATPQPAESVPVRVVEQPKADPTPAAEPEQKPAGNPLNQVTEEMVAQIAGILSGKFLTAARWFVSHQWLPAGDFSDEATAAAYLERNLASLEPVRARRIIKNSESFIRSIEGAA